MEISQTHAPSTEAPSTDLPPVETTASVSTGWLL